MVIQSSYTTKIITTSTGINVVISKNCKESVISIIKDEAKKILEILKWDTEDVTIGNSTYMNKKRTQIHKLEIIIRNVSPQVLHTLPLTLAKLSLIQKSITLSVQLALNNVYFKNMGMNTNEIPKLVLDDQGCFKLETPEAQITNSNLEALEPIEF